MRERSHFDALFHQHPMDLSHSEKMFMHFSQLLSKFCDARNKNMAEGDIEIHRERRRARE